MQEIFSNLGIEPSYLQINEAQLASCFSVSQLASTVFAAVGCSLSDLIQQLGLVATQPCVRVDQTLASLWFAQSIQPVDWQMPPIWDAIAGDYRAQDGWIKLHTNLPHHREAALSVLGCEAQKKQVTAAVKMWNTDKLEAEIVATGGVAAALRSRQEWVAHPQGRAVANEQLIAWGAAREGRAPVWQPTQQRPLQGLRVLDLTRVLAGPVSTRTLAGFGAQVLRIDPPSWDEANVVPDITLGKRCARLDLQTGVGCATFEKLLADADILIHGYRPGALKKLGYGLAERQQMAPNLIEISLDAYGWSGPWAERRGFDSLVQMSCGIAHNGMSWAQRKQPTPLPVQALDHATGYIMAVAAIIALKDAVKSNKIRSARLSLARTAELLIAHPQNAEGNLSPVLKKGHFAEALEQTPWGLAKRLMPALQIDGTPMQWSLPACKLGGEPPRWR